jgi:hypothetical protein
MPKPMPKPIPDMHRRALAVLCERLPLSAVNWALTGSLGHRMQGVDVPVNDIDVQTDADGATAAAETLSEYMVEPPRPRESEWISSVFGQLVIGGAPVEIMGGLRKRAGTGVPLGPATDPAEHRLVVHYAGLAVPVLSLDYEAAAYEAIGRHERAVALRAALMRLRRSQLWRKVAWRGR